MSSVQPHYEGRVFLKYKNNGKVGTVRRTACTVWKHVKISKNEKKIKNKNSR